MATEARYEKAKDARQAVGLLRKPAGLNERLLNALLSISGCATLEEALKPLLDAALDLTKMDGGGVYWVQADVAVLRHHRGLPEAFLREVTRVSLTPPPVQTLLHLQEPVEIAELSSAMRELFHKHGIHHAFSFPLRARGILFGFLNVGSMRAEAPEKADIQALWVLVKQVESLFFRLYSEKALRESEERQRRLLENLKGSHFIYRHDTQGVLQYVSESLPDILGYTPAEFLGRYDKYMTDHPTNQTVHRHTELSIQGIRQPAYEVNLWHKDGSSRWLEVQEVAVLDASGQVIAVEGVAQDITERKRVEEALRESEQRYRTLWESALDGLVLYELLDWPRTGEFIDVNDGLCRMLGHSREEFLQLSPLDVVADDAKEAIPSLIANIRYSGRMLFETTLLAKDGRRIPVEVNVSVVQFAERRAALAIVRDVTERKRIEEMLRQANERLEEQVQGRTKELSLTIDRLQQAMEELKRRAGQLQKITLELSEAEERERTRLAEFLHDDLQQTLAAAKFHVSLLGSRLGGDTEGLELQEQIKQMLKDAIEKSRNLSHELAPPVLHQGDLAAIFEWLVGQMENRHGLTVQVEIRGHADSRSEPVRSFLYRAAQEILFNTAKHAQVQEARLRLQRVHDELWLTISDKGRGFDPAELAGATGSGLLTIRERAELLGGRMRIKSAPGRGSTFFIAVPDPAV